MRVAVLSDIHANLTALEAVVTDLTHVSPDLIVHGGDLVGSGARPAEVVDFVRDAGWPGVQGNTDEMLWNAARVAEYFSPPALQPFRAIVSRTITFTREAIGEERLAWLRALPGRWTGSDLTVVHARPDDCWRAPAPNASDAELLGTYGSLGTRCIVYGHIHCPYVRRLNALTVANSGAVSLSYDGDPRAAYAIIDGDQVTIRRVAYDIEREAAALSANRCPDAAWLADTLRVGAPLPPPD
ncbi:MAG TPA: metallophosphoesterase family protein [Gemmatimonadaceae bacterium]|nr:metallophosphoesterase family protein [Vicinamibacterales bacterium]